MNIAFIVVRPVNNAYSLFGITPLGTLYLATILRKKGHNVTVYDENQYAIYNEKKQQFLVSFQDFDFVGLSILSPAANRSYRILQTLHKLYPNLRTAVGGPHVLGDEQAQQFLQYADTVVKYEAEHEIDSIVKGEVDGIVYGQMVNDLDTLPIPDFSLIYNPKRQLFNWFQLTPISTTRGCPRNCEFCAVSNIHGKKIRRRSPEYVIEEMNLRAKQGYKRLFFTDDNFSVQPEKRKPLLEKMIYQREKGFGFDNIIVQDEIPGLLKGGDAYIDMMRRAGIYRIMLGVESFDDENLRNLGKHHSVSDSELAIKKLQRHGITVYAFCMAKPESDDETSIKKQFQKLKELGVYYADMTIETPVPGTTYWEKSKNKIIVKKGNQPDWDKWDYVHAVVRPHYMGVEQFQKIVSKHMRNFYSLSRAIKQFFVGKFVRGLILLFARYMSKKMYS